MTRRDFLQRSPPRPPPGCPSRARGARRADGARSTTSPPFGNVSLLHFTDCHAQLLPVHFREPSVNLGVGDAAGKPPHLVGEALLKHFGIKPGTREAHAFTYLDFDARGAARTARSAASRTWRRW